MRFFQARWGSGGLSQEGHTGFHAAAPGRRRLTPAHSVISSREEPAGSGVKAPQRCEGPCGSPAALFRAERADSEAGLATHGSQICPFSTECPVSRWACSRL